MVERAGHRSCGYHISFIHGMTFELAPIRELPVGVSCHEPRNDSLVRYILTVLGNHSPHFSWIESCVVMCGSWLKVEC